ncbi:MAG: hypothetical protein NVSMB32_07000 [Actinomycetota bacterium]
MDVVSEPLGTTQALGADKPSPAAETAGAAKPPGAAKPLIRLAIPVIAAAFVAVAWQGSSVGASRPEAAAGLGQSRVETRIVQDSAGLSQLSQQVAALQQSVDASNQAMAGQLATLKASVASLQSAIATAQQGIAGAQGATATQAKKVSDLSATLTAVNQQLWALQAQFQAQLRKLAGQPSGAATP